MNNEDYCSYELSKALKSAGFDWRTDHLYRKDADNGDQYTLIHSGFDNYNEHWSASDWCSAPLLYHAQKWLREKNELCVTVYAQPYNGLPYYTGYILFEGDEKEVLDQDGHWFDDYEKCLSETISAALELIKKGE